MDVNQLQSQNIAELTKFANELEVEEISGLSKQELIVKILEAHNKKKEFFKRGAFLKFWKRGMVFYEAQILIIYQVQMIFM